MGIRLFVISNESPFPPIQGGRVDQWSRFRLFKDRGCRLMLASWYLSKDGEPSAADWAALADVFDDVQLFPISRSFGALLLRLGKLPLYSPHVATRILTARDLERLLSRIRSFGPDVIWLDGLYGGATATRISRALDIPLVYRSNNIEFMYMRDQANQAGNWRDWIAWRLASVNLESFETHIQQTSSLVFDCSNDDLLFWRARGIKHSQWAPPLFTLVPEAMPSAAGYWARPWDIVFIGNLHAPNNMRGLSWFFDKVLPILRKARPALKLCVAGSRPSAAMRAILARTSGINFLENPPSSTAVLCQGRVLINPILTGSGINVKSVEMLFHDAYIVTTGIGVRGMPEAIRREFCIADTADRFAASILANIDLPYVPSHSRREARRLLGPAGIDPIIESIETMLDRRRRSNGPGGDGSTYTRKAR